MLSGLADFRRKKHGNLCTSYHYLTTQGRIKAGAVGISKGKKPRCCRNKDFRSFLQERMQALIFGYFFIKEKVKALRWLTEASPSESINRRLPIVVRLLRRSSSQ
jgi:hypothetical protein